MYVSKLIQFFKEVILQKQFSYLFLFFAFIVFVLNFFISPKILLYLEKTFKQKFVFFSIGEPIISLIRFSFFLTFITVFPVFWYVIVKFLDWLFNFKKKFFFLFLITGIALFYIGTFFAYKISFPYGIKFLLSFAEHTAEPAISLSHFVNFFSFFLIVFGLIFELPLVLCFLSLLKVISPQKLKNYRKEIFFVIVIISAIITPTPDAFNMSILVIPIYILFEIGLFLGNLVLKRSIFTDSPQKELERKQQPSQEA